MENIAIYAGVFGLVVFIFVNIFLKKDEGKRAILEAIQYMLWVYIPFAIYIEFKNPQLIFFGTVIGTISIVLNIFVNINNAIYIYFYSDGILGKKYYKDDRKTWMSLLEDISGILKSIWIISLMFFFIQKESMMKYSIVGAIGGFLLFLYLFSFIRHFVKKEVKVLKIVPKISQVVRLEVFTTFFLGVMLLIIHK